MMILLTFVKGSVGKLHPFATGMAVVRFHLSIGVFPHNHRIIIIDAPLQGLRGAKPIGRRRRIVISTASFHVAIDVVNDNCSVGMNLFVGTILVEHVTGSVVIHKGTTMTMTLLLLVMWLLLLLLLLRSSGTMGRKGSR